MIYKKNVLSSSDLIISIAIFLSIDLTNIFIDLTQSDNRINYSNEICQKK